jgi:hypothetical protein
LDWNVIVTVKTGAGQERDLLGAPARRSASRASSATGLGDGRIRRTP